jgi:hypothetical protein
MVVLVSAPILVAGQNPTPPSAAANAASPAAARWVAPRAADGHPDLQGTWDYRSATPLERPREFGDREFLTPDEIAVVEQRASERGTRVNPTTSIHAGWWLDYGTKVVGTHRTSLVVDPPDGRIPPMTAEAQAREAARRAAASSHPDTDDPENRNLWERCITRGIPDAMLPNAYNNNLQIVQNSAHVVILLEMIHDARIVPLDGSPHAPSSIRPWMGDSRGRWEGDTLVIETTNFSNRTNFRGAGENLKLVERFTRSGPDALTYRFTVEDPTTWTRPWTVELPMVRADGELYEYACHEGNYGLKNMLSNARAEEKAASPR